MNTSSMPNSPRGGLSDRNTNRTPSPTPLPPIIIHKDEKSAGKLTSDKFKKFVNNMKKKTEEEEDPRRSSIDSLTMNTLHLEKLKHLSAPLSPDIMVENEKVYELDLDGFTLAVPIVDMEYVLKSPRLWTSQKENLVEEDDYSHVTITEIQWKTEPDASEYICALEEPVAEYVNPLWEEAVFNLNPFHDGNGIYENPLHESEIVIYNQLFVQPDENAPYWPADDFLRFESDIENLLKRSLTEKSTNKTFVGYLLTQKLLQLFPTFIVYEDAYILCQNLMNWYFFKDVRIKNQTFSEDNTYQFVEQMDEIPVYKGQMHFNRVLHHHQYETKPCPWRVARNIDNLIKSICDVYVKVNPFLYDPKPVKSIGYKTLWKSELFMDLKLQARKLQKVDPTVYTDTRKISFFINLYNVMVLHGLSRLKDPNDIKERESFFNKRFYTIGNHNVDLITLKNEILFGNGRYTRYHGLFPHPDLAIPFDPRIHFCLHDGTIESPVLRGEFSEYDLEKQIKTSTKLFMRTEVEWDDDKKIIMLPRLFNDYKLDFGEDNDEFFAFIAKHLLKDHRQAFLEKSKTFEVQYKQGEGKWNLKPRDEEIQGYEIQFHEIRDNPELRGYFRKFCEAESSTENIDCWEQILNYRKVDDPERRYVQAVGIYDTFMAPRASREINVNKKAIIKIREEIELEKREISKNPRHTPNVQLTIFDNIQKMLDVIMVDSYMRFKFDKSYYQLIERFIDSIHLTEDEDKEETEEEEHKKRGSVLFGGHKSDSGKSIIRHDSHGPAPKKRQGTILK